jgi:hypothetical protein
MVHCFSTSNLLAWRLFVLPPPPPSPAATSSSPAAGRSGASPAASAAAFARSSRFRSRSAATAALSALLFFGMAPPTNKRNQPPCGTRKQCTPAYTRQTESRRNFSNVQSGPPKVHRLVSLRRFACTLAFTLVAAVRIAGKETCAGHQFTRLWCNGREAWPPTPAKEKKNRRILVSKRAMV